MNSSGKFLAPIVTGGFPEPGLPPPLLLSSPPPQAASPTVSAVATSATMVLRNDDPLTVPSSVRLSMSLRRGARRRPEPGVVPRSTVGGSHHRCAPAHSARRQQVLDPTQAQVDQQRQGGDPHGRRQHTAELVAGLVDDDL